MTIPKLGWGVLPASLCTAATLAHVRRAGIDVIMIGGNAAELRPQLDTLADAGLRALVWESTLTKIDRPDWSEPAQALVDAVKSHPAVFAIGVMDEPAFEHFPAVREKMDFLNGQLPEVLYVNAYGFGRRGAESYWHLIDQYLHQLRPPFLSFDCYPLCRIPPQGMRNVTYNYDDDCGREVPELNAYYRRCYFDAWETCRQAALRYSVPLWGFALATPHQHTIWNYGPVTESTVRLEVFTALAHGSKVIQYFTLPTIEGSGWSEGILNLQGEPSPRYDIFARINREIEKISPILAASTCRGVYYTGDSPDGCRSFTAPRGERDTTHHPLAALAGDPLLISFLTAGDGQRYMMLVNRHPHHYAAAKMTLCEGWRALEVLKSSGQVNPEHKTRDLIGLEAGEGKLYRLEPLAGVKA